MYVILETTTYLDQKTFVIYIARTIQCSRPPYSENALNVCVSVYVQSGDLCVLGNRHESCREYFSKRP